MLSVCSIHTSCSYRKCSFSLQQPSHFLPQRLHTVLTTHQLMNQQAHNSQRHRGDQLHPPGNTSPSEVVQSPPFCFHFPSTLEQNAFFQKRLSSDSPSASSRTHLPIHNEPRPSVHPSHCWSHLPLNHTPLLNTETAVSLVISHKTLTTKKETAFNASSKKERS